MPGRRTASGHMTADTGGSGGGGGGSRRSNIAGTCGKCLIVLLFLVIAGVVFAELYRTRALLRVAPPAPAALSVVRVVSLLRLPDPLRDLNRTSQTILDCVRLFGGRVLYTGAVVQAAPFRKPQHEKNVPDPTFDMLVASEWPSCSAYSMFAEGPMSFNRYPAHEAYVLTPRPVFFASLSSDDANASMEAATPVAGAEEFAQLIEGERLPVRAWYFLPVAVAAEVGSQRSLLARLGLDISDVGSANVTVAAVVAPDSCYPQCDWGRRVQAVVSVGFPEDVGYLPERIRSGSVADPEDGTLAVFALSEGFEDAALGSERVHAQSLWVDVFWVIIGILEVLL